MIVSVHHYELTDDAESEDFERSIAEAEERDLFALPGLVEYRFVRGIKGARKARYAAIWEYESREAWEALWGPIDDPFPKAEYPERWKTWEDELLDPLLAGDPDDIEFTAYEAVRDRGG